MAAMLILCTATIGAVIIMMYISYSLENIELMVTSTIVLALSVSVYGNLMKHVENLPPNSKEKITQEINYKESAIENKTTIKNVEIKSVDELVFKDSWVKRAEVIKFDTICYLLISSEHGDNFQYEKIDCAIFYQE